MRDPRETAEGIVEMVSTEIAPELACDPEPHCAVCDSPSRRRTDRDVRVRCVRFEGVCRFCGARVAPDRVTIEVVDDLDDGVHSWAEGWQEVVPGECPDCGSEVLPTDPALSPAGVLFDYDDTVVWFVEKQMHTHHTQYEPEETMIVCINCHAKIHNRGGFMDHLKPIDERPKP